MKPLRARRYFHCLICILFYLSPLLHAAGREDSILKRLTHPTTNAGKKKATTAFGAITNYLELGPLLGNVGATEAKIWAKAAGPGEMCIGFGKMENLSDAKYSPVEKLQLETFFSTHLQLTNLEPSNKYFYCVMLNGEAAMARPYPSFNTAPSPGTKEHLRFAFVSCVGYNNYDSAPTWAEMATRTNFDILLMLGDNHYGNTTDPAQHLKKYAEQRHLAAYAEIARHVPEYAIWDNHDYSPEPCDKTARNKEQTLRAFKMFWPNLSYGEPDNPGVYYKFSHGAIDFFMTDNRYERSPDNAPDNEDKTYLGTKQMAWLKRELLASKAPVKVLASGGEFESYGVKNSWANFKHARDELFKFIEDNHITGVLLISGDRHFTAAYQVSGKFIEVTSGPTGSKFAEAKLNPEVFFYGSKGKYFCIYDIDTRPVEPVATIEIYKTADGLIERRTFSWDEVLGKKKIEPLTSANKSRVEK